VDRVGSVPPGFRFLFPQPNDPVNILWLAAKILEPRYALAAVVLRMHRYLDQRFGDSDVTRWIRKPGYVNLASQTFGIETCRKFAQAGMDEFCAGS
jgi:hypothetical protein